MSEGNPYEGLSFDVAIREFVEQCKNWIKSNYLKGQNDLGSWFRGNDKIQIQSRAEDLFTYYGKTINWIPKWVSSIEVAAAFANKTGTVDDVTFIVDDWEEYYKNSN